MILFKKLNIKSLTKKIKSLQQSREHNQASPEALAKEVNLYYALIKVYQACLKKKKYPFADIMIKECLRAAASLENAQAQYELAQKLLNEAKFRKTLEEGKILANTSNERQALHLFGEALAYLQSADNLGHIQAKRLHGLCFINGWGTEVNKKKGFDLIISSIEQEGSWDKVPQIFAAIGLNKPEFFSALVKHKEGKRD